ncbi:MAG: DMT family transporter [Allobaculum sp.]
MRAIMGIGLESAREKRRYIATQTSQKQSKLSLFVGALFCTMLWGMAPSLIKTGYSLMNVVATGSILLYAGCRFFLAGWMVLAFASIREKRFLMPARKDLKAILVLAFFQTFGQYLFYYLGAAHVSGMMVSVLSGSSALMALMMSAWLFHLEKMTVLKAGGCILGFVGILVANFNQGGFTFSASGEGMVLISQLSSALSSILIQIFSRKSSPVLLSGWQFVLGGLGLIVAGCLQGEHAIAWSFDGILVLLMLAFVSAGAYTVWGVLLSKWLVSSVGVFGCLNGIFGVMFSALLLHEPFSVRIILAAILTSAGILLVNMKIDRNDKHQKALRA